MPKRRYTAEYLRERARELFAERGDDLALFEFSRLVGVNPTTILARLGNWASVRESFGLPPRGRPRISRKYTHEMIVERLR